ncbi:MAG: diguanylate cyclase [Chloroflexi bacterium]|nr:diguanylate cyclase [Chloroflexota bacterium]
MRILIAEDNLTERTVLAGVLKNWGHEVRTVDNGLSAWEILQQPDAARLVILDWMMPGLDGLEVIKRVRALPSQQPPYIVLLTSKDEKNDVFSGLESGANDFIRKPFDRNELYARVRVGQRSIELQTSLYETQQTLTYLATHDSLTGILNRRAILEQLLKEISRVRRGGPDGSPLGLTIGFFDIDHFKQINDQHGHQAGDEILKALVGIVSKQLRTYDYFGRLGGDEFLVVTPGASDAKSENIFERLAKKIAAAEIETVAGQLFISISIGVASIDPETYELDKLLANADAALYQAKNAGRNQVVWINKPKDREE